MNEQEKQNLLLQVEKLNNNTSDGLIINADTILIDLINANDFEFIGFAQDIFAIWKQSKDKQAVEELFYEFTDMEFTDYLLKCKNEITKANGFDNYLDPEPELE